VKTVGIVDTNANPEVIDYPIPANDDATGSIKLITHYIIDAWIEGRQALIKSEKSKAETKEKEKDKEKEEKKGKIKEEKRKPEEKKDVKKKEVKKEKNTRKKEKK